MRPTTRSSLTITKCTSEITESVPLTHFDLCRSVLSEVRARGGVHLVVDDLGAGYSNLKRIADLEPKVVKLDRELIVDMHLSRRQCQLIAGVVKLCVDLGAVVVAEGIECADEYSALLDTGRTTRKASCSPAPASPCRTFAGRRLRRHAPALEPGCAGPLSRFRWRAGRAERSPAAWRGERERTSAATWQPSTLTLRHAFWILPFASTRNVLRSMPMYSRP